ncbi:phosphatidylinositol 3-kinase [Plasmodiophora brassicae]
MAEMWYYFYSADVNLDARINLVGIAGLDVDLPLRKGMSPATTPVDRELYVQCDLVMHGVVLWTTKSSYKCFGVQEDIVWREPLTLPLKYKDCNPSTFLVFTVWNVCSEAPLAGSAIPMFCDNNTLRFGLQKLKLWKGLAGDIHDTPFELDEPPDPLEVNLRKYAQRPLPRVGWLDKLLVPVVERTSLLGASKVPILIIEFPEFAHPIVFMDRPCNPGVPNFGESSAITDAAVMRRFYDPEIERNNPIEDKFQKLARSAVDGASAKPKLSERDTMRRIIASPNHNLVAAEKALLWQFRVYLTEDKHALIKFLRCVNWADAYETTQAVSLLDKWAPIEIADALGLLSAYFTNDAVREYAVRRLDQAGNKQLEMYLLQLVQALRFERTHPSGLSKFLIRRCSTSIDMATYMHWFVHVEQSSSSAYAALYSQFQEDFLAALSENAASQDFVALIANQHKLCEQLQGLAADLKGRGFKAQRERLALVLAEGGQFESLRVLPEAIRLPILPDICINGVVEADVFKSSMAPLALTCSTSDHLGGRFRVMFKTGDDLRQDQLIIQIINLMDQILKRVNLDLRLSPYRVLATSTSSGFVELVPDCKNLRAIISEYGASNNAIRVFFETMCSKPSELQSVLDCFVKSCAGYCVITYILGIGDRHLDNLLLTRQGNLFHIDFGFAFGRDPKPFPPPMKLCKEMVEAMGGSKSSHYRLFEGYCCQAFNILRKSASLILNLLSLMSDSGIPDLAGDVAEKTLIKVQEKFRLDLSDEEAEQVFLNLITESVTALFPQVIDRIHNWALYWK